MQAIFKYTLDPDEIENIKAFCDSAEYCSIEQYPGWHNLFSTTRTCYFYLCDQTGIRSFCQINEVLKFAQINFGPVCCDRDLILVSIKEIIGYYKKKHFVFLDIQMFYKSGYDTDYIEYHLNSLYRIKYLFDNAHTKSSIEIDLGEELDVISGRFSENIKRNIKKAQKLGVTIEKLSNKSDLEDFATIYSKMRAARKLPEGELKPDAFGSISEYLDTQKRGQIYIAKDNSQKVIGGVIIIKQGNSVRYYKGASDPDRRDLPVNHLALFEALKQAKTEGFNYFDFWGINHFADSDDQVYFINQFKKGFGGYYTFFAKKMNVSLIPFGFSIFQLLSFSRNLYKKIPFLNK
jgi:hypothetical protein